MTKPEFSGQNPELPISQFFRNTVSGLLEANAQYTIFSDLSDGREAKVLHLIDAHPPQPFTYIQYHVVYETREKADKTTIHGVFLANPWKRKRAPRKPASEMPIESRHYFTVGRDVVVREDQRTTGRYYELLPPIASLPTEVEDQGDAVILFDLYHDMQRIKDSHKVRPMRLVFKQFAQYK